jgi:polar amino acid transport system substrate-binding protein
VTAATPPRGIEPEVRRQLLPTGKLRAGVVQAPTAGVFFVGTDAQARPQGVTVDLATQLALRLGADPIFSMFPNSGVCTDTLAAGGVDVAFMPVDELRRGKVDFGPAYYLLRSTFLIAAGTGMRTIADYRKHGSRFVAIAGTTTLRAAERTFGKDRAVEVPSVEEALAIFGAGAVDAVALSEDYLRAVQSDYPGSLVMEDAFQETSISIAVGKGRPAALVAASRFLEDSKKSGLVRAIFDRHGLAGEPVAPPGV